MIDLDISNEQKAENIIQLIDDVFEIAANHGVNAHLDGEREYINMDGVPCNGVFIDHPSPQLVVACKKSQDLWLPILVHESCHMDQWIEQCKAWTDSKIGDNTDKMDILSLWLNGYVDLNKNQLDDYIRGMREVELDCEKRSVVKIMNYGLGIDVKEYIQKANAYVMFYNYMMKKRTWYTPGQEPYNTPAIWGNMPDHWLKSYEPIMCSQYMSLYGN